MDFKSMKKMRCLGQEQTNCFGGGKIKLFRIGLLPLKKDLLLNKLNLLIKLLNDRQIMINNDEIFSFITKRINRTYLDIYNFVDRIDKLSLSKKRQITIPLIKELM